MKKIFSILLLMSMFITAGFALAEEPVQPTATAPAVEQAAPAETAPAPAVAEPPAAPKIAPGIPPG
jgi:hypothetical protein